MTFTMHHMHHATALHGWPPVGAAPRPAGPWARAIPPRCPTGTTPPGNAAMRSEVMQVLGGTGAFSRVYGLHPWPARFVQGHVCAAIADQLAGDGYGPGQLRKLVRKARRVDGLRRLARAEAVTLTTTLPVVLASGVGALAGASVGAAAGGVGAVVGAPVGALIGACTVAPAAAMLSTAMYAIDAQHRKGAGREFTDRVPRTPLASRAYNAVAYGSGTFLANAPLTTTQAIASTAMAAGLATTAIWGGIGLAVAPAVALGGTAVRVGLQEATTRRVPGRMQGLSRGQAPEGGGVQWDILLMRESLRRLERHSTPRLVWDDLKHYTHLLRRQLPGELRKAVHPRHGLGQTALNATLLVGGQALGQGVAAGATAAGAPAAAATAFGRLAQHGPGAAAWGAGRPVPPPGRRPKPLHGPAL